MTRSHEGILTRPTTGKHRVKQQLCRQRLLGQYLTTAPGYGVAGTMAALAWRSAFHEHQAVTVMDSHKESRGRRMLVPSPYLEHPCWAGILWPSSHFKQPLEHCTYLGAF